MRLRTVWKATALSLAAATGALVVVVVLAAAAVRAVKVARQTAIFRRDLAMIFSNSLLATVGPCLLDSDLLELAVALAFLPE